MKVLYPLIKPASSLCNMRCAYCFYADVSVRRQFPSRGIMGKETAESIINNIFDDLEDGDEVTFAFQGGEPTLAGLQWFRDFAEMVSGRGAGRKITVRYAFQTNGLLLDDEWCEFFKAHDFLVGLSLDGGKAAHDRNRLDAKGQGTYGEVLARKELLEKHSVEYNILCVLTNELAADPERVWRFIQREKINYIQFIPCLDELNGNKISQYALRPARFASFYTRLFAMWNREMEAGRYISVKFFDDVANYFFKNLPTVCGINGQCQRQCVIEADGTVYPCDFYALDEYNTGNLKEKKPGEVLNSEKALSFLREKPELPGMCGTCAYRKACGGGCKRMRHVMYCGSGEVMCGYRSFLDKCLAPLEQTLRRLYSRPPRP